MKKTDLALLAVVLLLGAYLAFWYRQPEQSAERPLEIPAETTVQPVVVDEPEEPPIRYPLPETGTAVADENAETGPEPGPAEPDQEAEPLPSLDESDPLVRGELDRVLAMQPLGDLLNLDNVIRRFVITVDNLPRKHFPRSKYMATRATAGRFLVSREQEQIYLSPDNFARYTPFVQMFEAVDETQVVPVYVRLYSLFQEAYEGMGYPAAYFNDRLIDVIDHLLDTPDIVGPVRLIQPHVLYKYADPDLEALSAGQKVLIRVGPDNASRIKAKLRLLRDALAGEVPS